MQLQRTSLMHSKRIVPCNISLCAARRFQRARSTIYSNSSRPGIPLLRITLRLLTSSVSLTQLQLQDIVDDRLHTKELAVKSLLEIPANILAMVDLTSLNLASNAIKLIPNSISQLQNLTLLDVSHNPIQALPSGLGNLHKLKTFRYSNVPLRIPPKEVLAKSLRHILAYLRDLGKMSNPIFRTKVMVRLRRIEIDTMYSSYFV